MKKYKGTIILESLTDDRVLNGFNIVEMRVTDEDDPSERWHILTVAVDELQAKKLSNYLKQEKWYADFQTDDEVILIYPNKVFKFKKTDKDVYLESIQYGKSIGIPDEQLDFLKKTK